MRSNIGNNLTSDEELEESLNDHDSLLATSRTVKSQKSSNYRNISNTSTTCSHASSLLFFKLIYLFLGLCMGMLALTLHGFETAAYIRIDMLGILFTARSAGQVTGVVISNLPGQHDLDHKLPSFSICSPLLSCAMGVLTIAHFVIPWMRQFWLLLPCLVLQGCGITMATQASQRVVAKMPWHSPLHYFSHKIFLHLSLVMGLVLAPVVATIFMSASSQPGDLVQRKSAEWMPYSSTITPFTTSSSSPLAPMEASALLRMRRNNDNMSSNSNSSSSNNLWGNNPAKEENLTDFMPTGWQENSSTPIIITTTTITPLVTVPPVKSTKPRVSDKSDDVPKSNSDAYDLRALKQQQTANKVDQAMNHPAEVVPAAPPIVTEKPVSTTAPSALHVNASLDNSTFITSSVSSSNVSYLETTSTTLSTTASSSTTSATTTTASPSTTTTTTTTIPSTAMTTVTTTTTATKSLESASFNNSFSHNNFINSTTTITATTTTPAPAPTTSMINIIPTKPPETIDNMMQLLLKLSNSTVQNLTPTQEIYLLLGSLSLAFLLAIHMLCCVRVCQWCKLRSPFLTTAGATTELSSAAAIITAAATTTAGNNNAFRIAVQSQPICDCCVWRFSKSATLKQMLLCAHVFLAESLELTFSGFLYYFVWKYLQWSQPQSLLLCALFWMSYFLGLLSSGVYSWLNCSGNHNSKCLSVTVAFRLMLSLFGLMCFAISVLYWEKNRFSPLTSSSDEPFCRILIWMGSSMLGVGLSVHKVLWETERMNSALPPSSSSTNAGVEAAEVAGYIGQMTLPAILIYFYHIEVTPRVYPLFCIVLACCLTLLAMLRLLFFGFAVLADPHKVLLKFNNNSDDLELNNRRRSPEKEECTSLSPTVNQRLKSNGVKGKMKMMGTGAGLGTGQGGEFRALTMHDSEDSDEL